MKNGDIYIEEIADSKEVMQASAPPVARWFISILLAVVALAVCFLFFMKRDVAIDAHGIIETNQATETVVSASGGKVAVNKVESGSLVTAGEVLIELDTKYAVEQQGIIEKSLNDAETDISGLETLKQSYEQNTNLLPVDNPFYSKYQEYSAECRLIAENENVKSTDSQKSHSAAISMSNLYKTRIENLNQEIAELGALQAAISNFVTFSSSNAYVQSIYNSYANEYALTSKTLGDAEARLKVGENDFAIGRATQTDLDLLKEAVDVAQLQLDAIKSNYIERVQTDIATKAAQKSSYEDQQYQLSSQPTSTDNGGIVSATMNQLQAQRITEAETTITASESKIENYKLQLLELDQQIQSGVITANTSGIIMFNNEITAGSIIQPGETILSIVPSTEEFEVSLYVSDGDIAKVNIGAPVQLSVSALPYQEYGRLTGLVTYVSATSIPIENVGQVYLVKASISETELSKTDGSISKIASGMTVKADVVSGSETWIKWLLREINLID